MRLSNIEKLKTKNKKMHRPYQIPTTNLSKYETNFSFLKYGLHHSFIGKIRFIKWDLGVKLESLASNVDEFVSPEVKEEFYQLL